MSSRFPHFARYALWGSLGLSGLTLLLFAYLGTLMRMVADDFCSASRGLRRGAWEGMLHRYETWAGNYSNAFTKYLFAPLQPEIHAWLPALTLVAWVLVLWYTLAQVGRSLRLPNALRWALPLAVLLTFILYRVMPSTQHIIWYAAIIPNVWSLLLSTLLIGLVIHFFHHKRPMWLFILLLLTVVVMIVYIGGLKETLIPIYVGALGLLLLLTPWMPRARRRAYLVTVLVALVSSLVVMAVVAGSPGAHARRDVLLGGRTVSFERLITESLLYTGSFWIGEPAGITYGETFTLAYFGMLFFVVLLGGLLFLEKNPAVTLPAPRRLGLTMLLVLAAGLILTLAAIMPIVYGVGALSMRPLAFPRFVQLGTWLVLAYLALAAIQRSRLLPRLARAKTWPVVLLGLSFMLLWLPLVTLVNFAQRIPDYRAYAQSWDARHDMLQAAPDGEIIVVEPLAFDMNEHLVLESVEDDARFWINNCIALFYGLEGVVEQEADP